KINFLTGTLPHVANPQIPCLSVETRAERVPQSVGPDLVVEDRVTCKRIVVGDGVVTIRLSRKIVRWIRATPIDFNPQHFSQQIPDRISRSVVFEVQILSVADDGGVSKGGLVVAVAAISRGDVEVA